MSLSTFLVSVVCVFSAIKRFAPFLLEYAFFKDVDKVDVSSVIPVG